LQSIILSHQYCEVYFISLTVVNPQWGLATKYYWNRPPYSYWLDPPLGVTKGLHFPSPLACAGGDTVIFVVNVALVGVSGSIAQESFLCIHPRTNYKHRC